MAFKMKGSSMHMGTKAHKSALKHQGSPGKRGDQMERSVHKHNEDGSHPTGNEAYMYDGPRTESKPKKEVSAREKKQNQPQGSGGKGREGNVKDTPDDRSSGKGSNANTKKKTNKPDWSTAPKNNTQARINWYKKHNLKLDSTTTLPTEKLEGQKATKIETPKVEKKLAEQPTEKKATGSERRKAKNDNYKKKYEAHRAKIKAWRDGGKKGPRPKRVY